MGCALVHPDKVKLRVVLAYGVRRQSSPEFHRRKINPTTLWSQSKFWFRVVLENFQFHWDLVSSQFSRRLSGLILGLCLSDPVFLERTMIVNCSCRVHIFQVEIR